MALAQIGSIEMQPVRRPAVEAALDELERVYGFIYSRVGNREDAEDLTQQVAMKALHNLRDGAYEAEVRAYLFATARSVLATFWEGRARMKEFELLDNLAARSPGDAQILPPADAVESVTAILGALKPSYRVLLELRFLRGYSLREVATEMGKTVGSVKVMQLRALRQAATVIDAADVARLRRLHPRVDARHGIVG